MMTSTHAHHAERLFVLARARGREAQLPYEGALTPTEAHDLAAIGAARIIDVRFRFEHEYVGRVAPPVGSTLVQWRVHDGSKGHQNLHFVDELRAHVSDTSTPLLFLCRSAVRSHHAAKAATEAGFQACFNILEGFEGDPDAQGQRGKTGGWRFAGLPWTQD